MEFVKNILLVAFTSVIIENTVFSRVLGTSTLILVAKNRKNIFGFGLSVTYITAVVSVLTYFVGKLFDLSGNSYIYIPLVYILILGVVYILTLLCLWRFAVTLFVKIRKYIHMSAFNCAVLGAMFIISEYCETFTDYLVQGIGIGLGFVLAVYMTSIVYDRVYSEKVPYSFRGFPLLMIYIGILSMAFWGFSGHIANY